MGTFALRGRETVRFLRVSRGGLRTLPEVVMSRAVLLVKSTHQTIELYSGIHVFYIIIGTVQNHDKCPRFDARDGIPDFVVAFFVVFLGGLYLLDAQFLYVLVQVLLSKTTKQLERLKDSGPIRSHYQVCYIYHALHYV